MTTNATTSELDPATHIHHKWADVLRGCAYGDAWGNRNEFQSYAALTHTNKRGPELPAQLIITDDTQMTLALARAIDSVDPDDTDALKSAIISEFVTWRSDPDNNRAPGNTCMAATRSLASGVPWTTATITHSDGCGTVMRTSPAAFLPRHLWRPVAAWQAAITHGKATGIAATLITTAVTREAAQGHIRPGNALRYAIELAANPALRAGVGPWLAGHPQAATADEADRFVAEGLAAVEQLLRRAQIALPNIQAAPWAGDPCRHGGEGWRAQEALATALLCVDALPDDPVAALRRATVTGGDSDSIAAVAGAILGAMYTSPWPSEWAARLEPRYREWITDAAGYRFTANRAATSTAER